MWKRKNNKFLPKKDGQLFTSADRLFLMRFGNFLVPQIYMIQQNISALNLKINGI